MNTNIGIESFIEKNAKYIDKLGGCLMNHSRPTVFRIQDYLGKGPWKPGFSMAWASDRTSDDYLKIKSPDIRKIRLASMMSDMPYIGYGCLSEDDLRIWINKEEYSRLKEFGYRSVFMTADRILMKTENQCLFSRAYPLIYSTHFDLWK